MGSSTTLSTVIDSSIKKAASAYCKRRGLKLRYLVEEALLEKLEDEIDLEAYYERRNEETVAMEKLLRPSEGSAKGKKR